MASTIDRHAGEGGGGDHLPDGGLVLAGELGDGDGDGLGVQPGEDDREDELVPALDEGEHAGSEEGQAGRSAA